MAITPDGDLQLNNDYTYGQYVVPPTIAPVVNISGDINIVTTINGSTGPITLQSPEGWSFSGGVGGIVSMTVSNPSLARSALVAARSGLNDDITSFSALTGNTGVNPWTGTPNGSSQSTYPATVASALYSQTEMQDLMDKMQDVTEFMMFLVAALLAPGIVET